MTKFKRTIASLLCAVMILGSAPLGALMNLDFSGLFDFKAEAAEYSGTCGEGLTWVFNDETGKLTISGTGEMTDWWPAGEVAWYNYRSDIKTVSISDGVTSIGENAFYECSGLTSITIPNSVESIEANAFSCCSGLTSIIISDSVESIGACAFSDCTGLTSITIPDSVYSISGGVFEGCTSLKSVTLSNNIIGIYAEAFRNCTSLEKIDIPDGATSIGESAFEGCTSLASITIPDSVTKIYEYAFRYCEGLISIEIPDSVTYLGNSAFYNCKSLKSVEMPNGITSVSLYTFKNCESLEKIEIPDGVTVIESNAFEGCTSLKSVTIPDTVTEIGYDAFVHCESLKSIVIPNGITYIDANTFTYCTSLENVTIPNSVKHIGDEAFWGCSSLKNITIPNSVTTIDSFAFTLCTSLESITIPDSVISIESWAFSDCTSLESVTIPNSVLYIRHRAFENCTALESITIPGSVITLESFVFAGCTSLANITIPESVTGIDADAFNDTAYSNDLSNWDYYVWDADRGMVQDGILYIGKHLIQMDLTVINYDYSIREDTLTIADDAVKSLPDDWYELVFPDGVKYIGGGSFGVNHVEKITIPDSVTKIGDLDLYGTPYIKNEDNWENGALYIGKHLIDTDDSINSEYTVKDGTLTIAGGAFRGRRNITEVKIPNSVINIGDSAFSYCTNLESVTLSESIERIEFNTFNKCANLTSITIPKKVKSIGLQAFYDCGLTYAYYPGTYDELSVEKMNYELESVLIFECDSDRPYYSGTCGDNLSWTLYTDGELVISGTGEMPDWSYYGVPWYGYRSVVKTVTISDGVTRVGENAFCDCTNLTSVTISNSVTSMGDDAFYGCSALTNVYYKGDITSWCAIKYPNNLLLVFAAPMCYAKNLHIDGTLVSGNIVIPNSCKSIGDWAFTNVGITGITIPKSVTSIGGWAFYNCTSLTDVYYEGTEEEWKAITVSSYGNTVLSSVTIHYNSGACAHSYTSVITKQPTCSEAGIKTYTCGKCGNSYTEDIAKKAHTVGNWETEKEATCIEKGSEVKKCTVCKETLETRETAELGHDYKSVTTDATCKAPGKTVYTCSRCKDFYEVAIPQKEHELKKVTVEATCTEKGSEYNKCELCGDTIGEVTTIPAKGHTEGEWETVLKPTIDADGKKVKKCTVCKEVVKEEAIEKLASSKDETTGVELGFDKDDYDGRVQIVVEEKVNGTAFNIVNTQTGAVKSHVFDITMTLNGEAVQPNGKVVVRIPLPEGYDPKRTFVCFVDAEKNTIETIDSEYVNGYFVFETDHFSYYSLVELGEAKLTMTAPAKADYKTEATVSVSAENLPQNAKITWSASGAKVNLTPSADGKSCKVTFLEKGDVTIKATTADMNGKEVTESTKISVKYTWWQWILIILLFGWIWY